MWWQWQWGEAMMEKKEEVLCVYVVHAICQKCFFKCVAIKIAFFEIWQKLNIYNQRMLHRALSNRLEIKF